MNAKLQSPENKIKFSELYKIHSGHVGNTCHEFGIARKTFYENCNSDPEFKALIDDIEQSFTDSVEIAFRQSALEKSFHHQRFYLVNRRPEKWKDTRQVGIENIDGKPFEVKISEQFMEKFADAIKDCD